MSVAAPKPLVAMIANYPKGVGYAWWLMERFWGEAALSAKLAGWHAVVVYPGAEGHAADCSIGLLESFLSGGELREIRMLARLVRQRNIKSIYLTDRPYLSWKYLLLRLCGVRSIVVHDHTPGDRPRVGGLKGMVKLLVNSLPWMTANLSVAVSPLMRKRQLENGRLPARKVALVTNGIIVRELIVGAREQLVRRFGVDPECFIVCAVGRLSEYKRFDFAIRGMAAAAKANEGLRPVLLLVGDGPDRLRLQRIADDETRWVRTIFAGHTDDVWPVLCGVDAVIHPSAGEGLSLAILEAMAAARPVVVPDIPSVSQSVRHGATGFVYADGSLDGVAQALGKLAWDPDLRSLIGGTAREHVLQEFTIERAVNDFRQWVVPHLLRNL